MQRKQPCVCGKAYWPAQAWKHEGCISRATVVADVEAVVEPVKKKPAYKGYKDPEKRRIYMRELMRKRRAGHH